VVDARGSIAWITVRGRNGAETYEVHTATTANQTELLDSGPQIGPTSLRLAPSGQISWLHAGRTLYAPLQ
jgi:hypothetical protein